MAAFGLLVAILGISIGSLLIGLVVAIAIPVWSPVSLTSNRN